MFRPKQTLLSISVVFAIILFAVDILKLRAQDKKQQEDPPTPIQLGVMTEKQRMNSKLYEIPSNNSRNNLLTNLKKSPAGFTVIFPGDEYLGIDPQRLPTQLEFIKKTTCEADIVLLGRVRDKSSQITEDLKAVFTDYEVIVDSIIFSKPRLNVNLFSSITITKLGGSILINNSQIDYYDKSPKRFKIGMSYILFLKYLPQSDSYKIVNKESAFTIKDGRVRQHGDQTPPYRDIIEHVNSFTTLTRDSGNRCNLKEN